MEGEEDQCKIKVRQIDEGANVMRLLDRRMYSM
jgi:hypothetical protein